MARIYKSCIKCGYLYEYSSYSVCPECGEKQVEVDKLNSIKHNMNFERFTNKERISLANVDTDYEPKHREKIKDFGGNK